jgi:hypothetical protein
MIYNWRRRKGNEKVKIREQNEEILIELLENTCNRLQQTTSKI